jgi:hypothetical protein
VLRFGVRAGREGNAVGFVLGWGLDAECVGKANEQAEKGRHVSCLGDLLIRPAGVAEALDLLVGDAIGRLAYRAGEVEKKTLRRKEAGRVEVTAAERLRYPLKCFALQLQEPRV